MQIYPDMGVAAMLKNQWQDAEFAFASLSDRSPVSEDDDLIVLAAPDPQGMLCKGSCLLSPQALHQWAATVAAAVCQSQTWQTVACHKATAKSLEKLLCTICRVGSCQARCLCSRASCTYCPLQP